MTDETSGTWWDRNWKWFVPVAGIGAVTILALFALVLLTVVFGMMKSSDPYQRGVAAAKEHAVVREKLGTPIEEGFFVTGNINISGPSGNADLAVPLSGPKGKATLYIVAHKSAGEWTFSKLVIQFNEGGQRVDLLEVTTPTPLPEI
jgi:cytochrome oxidase complex assembly protein 1